MKKIMRMAMYSSVSVSMIGVSIMPFDNYLLEAVAVTLLIYGMFGFLLTLLPAVYCYLKHMLSHSDEDIAYVGKTILVSIAFLLLMATVSSGFIEKTRIKHGKRLRSEAQLSRLYWQMIDYSTEHSGQLPSAERWCEILLTEEDQLDIMSLASSGVQVAFNRHLSEVSIYQIPTNAVLLFTAHGDLNLNGGYELMKHQNHDYAFLCLVDGRIVQYRLKDSKIVDLKYLHSRPPLFESQTEGSLRIIWQP